MSCRDADVTRTDAGKRPDQVWRPLTQHRGLLGSSAPTIVSGNGCYLKDENGRKLFDGLSGLWCVNVGYGRSELAEVARAQLEKLCFLAPVMVNEPVIQLAEKLQEMLGIDCHAYFTASGSEANEAAFKIARQYHLQNGRGGERRYKIISRYRAYHGNTMGAMAATGQAERKSGYDPGPAGFIHVPPPYPYRRHPKLSVSDHGADAAQQLEEAIIHEGAETVAAVIMEPVISGGGVIVPPNNYIPLVREICDRHGVLLIFDEIVSGFGRLGKTFGYEHWGQHADIFTFAKGLASGYMPIAATVASKHVFDAFDGEPGDSRHFRHINTYGGHPAAAAVALECMNILENENLSENARVVGDRLRAGLSSQIGDHELVGEIRGLGMLTGIELVADREQRTPLDDVRINKILGACLQKGVILGRNSNTIPGRCNIMMVAPPLTLSADQADFLVGVITDALTFFKNA